MKCFTSEVILPCPACGRTLACHVEVSLENAAEAGSFRGVFTPPAIRCQCGHVERVRTDHRGGLGAGRMLARAIHTPFLKDTSVQVTYTWAINITSSG